VKLSVNFVGLGRYWKAGEEIPDEDVPPRIAKYAVTVTGDDGVTETPAPDAPEPAPPAPKRQLKAGKRARR
jgi:hypothetical protein